MRRNKGFTLIELIMLISILGFVVLISVPNIDSYLDARIYSCAQKISSDIRYTQYLSIAEHRRYGVEFNVSANYYQVYEVDTGTLAIDPYSRAGMSLDLDTTEEYKGVSISSVNIDSSNELRFSSLGEPLDSSGNDLSAVSTIVLNYRGRSKTITVYPVTGWVEVQ
ncbi:MAG: prepilin-type N-terminal cleavage/methylation domain-containing protein [Candidatus Kaelpia aquatica]|nr:prepilin-type N-terminal cleavage/methylation domain-containing protein [Candidatus Kaelpia aquatica]